MPGDDARPAPTVLANRAGADAAADGLTGHGPPAEAEPLLDDAWDRARRAFGPDDPATLCNFDHHAWVPYRCNRYDASAALFREL